MPTFNKQLESFAAALDAEIGRSPDDLKVPLVRMRKEIDSFFGAKVTRQKLGKAANHYDPEEDFAGGTHAQNR